ncbi:hypothetical protein LOAG_03281 [Loa loa]|uniref:Uncharacterized protein n=1 Tax=Loa loa TaxID=7209 RepID=A0A1S0U4N6_LOALO|nr:hypothetical protein LOAG_03281 [Loa loa]EFO25201.1 hypothetical protein LOAG_03281 [Loa loa]
MPTVNDDDIIRLRIECCAGKDENRYSKGTRKFKGFVQIRNNSEERRRTAVMECKEKEKKKTSPDLTMAEKYLKNIRQLLSSFAGLFQKRRFSCLFVSAERWNQ